MPGMYERHGESLLPWRLFVRRWVRHGYLAAGALVVSLAIGTVGFHWLAGQSWLDAFLNAAMLLGGMGPVGEFTRPAGKLFAAFYALYAGIVFLGVAAVSLAPVVHRILHKFHLDEHAKGRRRR
jgi:hypothetical protein